MTKLPALVTTVAFLTLLGGALVQTFWHVAPQGELRGVTAPLPPIKASLKNWQDGSLQAQVEAWLERHVGFRPAAVRTENQINFSVFDELTRNRSKDIVLGQDDWLYERYYIDSYLGKDLAPLSFHQQFARDLRDLQDELSNRQIAFVLIISPSKAAVYPEHLPRGMAPDIPPLTNHQQLTPLLQRAQVNLIDAATKFRGDKAAHPELLLFPQGGTHWDYYGATLVLKDLMFRLSGLTNKPSVRFKIGPVAVDRNLQITENDLGDLLNLWTPDAFVSPLPHAAFELQSAPPESKLNLLWIGSSFSWTPLDLLTRTGGYEKCDFLYYDRTLYHFPPPSTFRSAARMSFAEKTQLLARQAVILEVNESSLVATGTDIYAPRFVRDALEYLRSDEAKAARPQSAAMPTDEPESTN